MEASAPPPEKSVSVLSIEAWRNPEGWDWNAWYRRGDAPLSVCDLSPRKLLRWMRDEGYLSEGSKGRVAIEDDQYNVVIVERHTREPLFAIAYGEAY